MPSLIQVAFTLHLIVEIPAAINFLFRPSSTLSLPQPHSHGVIRQYALLLFATNVIVALFLLRESYDELTARVAGALCLYHIGPIIRAAKRVRRHRLPDALGGPHLHLSAHALCAACLLASFIDSII